MPNYLTQLSNRARNPAFGITELVLFHPVPALRNSGGRIQ